MKTLILAALLLVSFQAAVAQESPKEPPKPLANHDIVEMSQAGLSAEIIVAKIKRSKCDFETSPAQLSELKSKGVADEIIKAMIEWKAEPEESAKELEEKEKARTIPAVAVEKILAALLRIENATSVGVTLQNYSQLLIENKSVIDENIKNLNDEQIVRDIEATLNDHQYALAVWNMAAVNGWAYFYTKQEPGRTLVTRYGYPVKISIWTNVPVMSGLGYVWLSARNRYNEVSLKLKKLVL